MRIEHHKTIEDPKLKQLKEEISNISKGLSTKNAVEEMAENAKIIFTLFKTVLINSESFFVVADSDFERVATKDLKYIQKDGFVEITLIDREVKE